MYTQLTSVKWLERSNIFTSTWFSSAQNSFILKFLVEFCGKNRRAHRVLARYNVEGPELFEEKI